jgi:antitoxin component of MazEF toxin-antitoxin module
MQEANIAVGDEVKVTVQQGRIIVMPSERPGDPPLTGVEWGSPFAP